MLFSIFSNKIIALLRTIHHLNFRKLYTILCRHALVGGFEVDAILVFAPEDALLVSDSENTIRISRSDSRWVGFELKEIDIRKAFNQAVIRAKFFDWFYIILNSSPENINKHSYLKECAKLGVISVRKGDPILVFSPQNVYIPSYTSSLVKIDYKVSVDYYEILDKKSHPCARSGDFDLYFCRAYD